MCRCPKQPRSFTVSKLHAELDLITAGKDFSCINASDLGPESNDLTLGVCIYIIGTRLAETYADRPLSSHISSNI